jgi:hypothetical protein
MSRRLAVNVRLSPRRWLWVALAIWSCWNSAWAQATPTPAPGEQKLRVVGGLAGVHQYVRNEEPFWTQELSRLTGGKYTAEIAPFDRSGVPGEEMLRLMELGVVPFGTALMSLSASQQPLLGALDLGSTIWRAGASGCLPPRRPTW